MKHYYLIEDDRNVDVVDTQDRVDGLAKHGWALVADLSGLEYSEVQRQVASFVTGVRRRVIHRPRATVWGDVSRAEDHLEV